MNIILNSAEVAVLFRQDPDTAAEGGFQGLLVRLQRKCDPTTGKILLSGDDLEKIPKCAFDYKNGGWQDQLLAIFGRSLGPKLGRE